MKPFINIGILIVFIISCKTAPEIKYQIPIWNPYDESNELEENADHDIGRMQYKLIQSKHLDKNQVWKELIPEIQFFGEEEYEALKPLILEQDVPTIQQHVKRWRTDLRKIWYYGICIA